MYAKFPYYSIAQMYAMTLDTPASILLGKDLLYWVVDPEIESEYAQQGCAVLSHSY